MAGWCKAPAAIRRVPSSIPGRGRPTIAIPPGVGKLVVTSAKKVMFKFLLLLVIVLVGLLAVVDAQWGYGYPYGGYGGYGRGYGWRRRMMYGGYGGYGGYGNYWG
ncbi:hypothetical protein PRIPAC_80303 [Pristionchus pacificus]|uniref:Uncharacterized protein n=1 Tax=Pristionchus pacificus TaxID=54126 RepID=A0A2A6CP65_PRIPA|nr:hypothetical protein PRIPAC_80303 [Pristionchus pacificus]|eukprot:PDM79992.1 hypothetical protein PRIPAC_32571 [Pristionchus pacificus]